MKYLMIPVWAVIILISVQEITSDPNSFFDSIMNYDDESMGLMCQSILSEVSDVCHKVTGTTQGFRNLTVGYVTWLLCIDNISELDDTDWSQPIDAIEKYCVAENQIHKCFDKLKVDVNVCVMPQNHHLVDFGLRLLKRITNFFCYDNAVRIKDFLANDGISCFSEKLFSDVAVCEVIDMTSEAQLQKLINFDQLDDREKCSKFNHLTGCFDSSLNGVCDKPMIINMVNDFTEMLRNETQCVQLDINV